SLELDCDAFEPFNLPTIFPSLETLVLRGIILDFKTPQYTITALYLSRLSHLNALSLSFLSSFPNLENLKLEDIRENDPSTSAPIVFDKIQSLILILPFESDSLITLKFPHLVHLDLRDSDSYTETNSYFYFSRQTAFSLLDQDLCGLTHLSIHRMLLLYNEVLKLFRLVPSLTHLDVEEPSNRFRKADTMRWVLELLAGPQHPGLPEAMATPEIDMDEDINSPFNHDDIDMAEEWDSEQEDENGSDEEDHNSDLQELLLPRLVALNLTMRPRNKLLLDVVRSRQPILEDNPGDRACLRTLRIRIRHSNGSARYPKIPAHVEAFQKSLKPFEERGLDVDIEIPGV
ncbi:hypothetical protein FB446DRAFT_818737, partial [Lentinula raphanica]